MPLDVIQRFLNYAINVHARAARNFKNRARLLIRDRNAGLPLDHWQIPIEALLESGFIEHHWMQRLRECANFLKSRLRDIADFDEAGIELGV